MKKLLFLAAATLSLAACNNNDDNYIDQPVEAHISATIGQSAVSRASETSWEEGDSIGISMTGNGINYVNLKYTTEAGNGIFTGTGMYFKTHIDPLTLIAYYPFTGSEDTTPEIVEVSTTADLQNPDGQPTFDFLYANLENVTGRNPNVEFTFAHKMSKISLIFKNGNVGTDISRITSYQIDGLILEGTFNPLTGVCSANADADPSTLALTIPAGTLTKGDELSPIIVFPQATAGKTVTLRIHDNEEQDYICKLDFGTEGLVSGNNYLYTITVSKTGLTVNSTIADWEYKELGSEAKSDDSDD